MESVLNRKVKCISIGMRTKMNEHNVNLEVFASDEMSVECIKHTIKHVCNCHYVRFSMKMPMIGSLGIKNYSHFFIVDTHVCIIAFSLRFSHRSIQIHPSMMTINVNDNGCNLIEVLFLVL